MLQTSNYPMDAYAMDPGGDVFRLLKINFDAVRGQQWDSLNASRASVTRWCSPRGLPPPPPPLRSSSPEPPLVPGDSG